ncbi:DUF3019 domain-containing protein [Marinobacter hydrocarbonoclasticus]|nr:DUF3019 domain-containing protein [Marinobacter nauticus]
MRWILLLSVALLTPGAQSDDTDWPTQFELRPSECLMPEQAAGCNVVIEFYWQLPESAPACLYKEDEETPLYCSDQSTTRIRLKFFIHDSTRFQLRLEDPPHYQAEQEFQLLRSIRQELRRRRKHAWSLT